MTALLYVLAAIGNGWDRAAAATAGTPRHVRVALASRTGRRTGIVATVAVLLLYLFAVGDIVISTSAKLATTPVVQAAPGNLFQTRAPYLFEPVLALRPDAHVSVFVSPLNLLLGAVVAALVGCNAIVAGYAAHRGSCRRHGYGRLFGALPAFLLGFACCAPTVLLALGAGVGAAILPVLLPLRPVFYPLTLVLLLVGLVWGTHQATRRDGRAS